ncbi:ABC transporter ATP-binding protein [Stackebrandtia nassauensis]|uniref:ABC transporter related protein n=1 Tax=Stackebrandtia nassauensis (strain DSM 44728 / CIP 108903 / NRRL B-16338 / NBRC 102104 / LLR-40K-21) TaxID=446470 RepID=D3PV61_STANL|nr:ABC transporter ATP-binding protein [Stackebrandtia nassauensis]ADD41114.1 ABC transporter related protein [Stackebrandtia nassauensis DSM 44728]
MSGIDLTAVTKVYPGGVKALDDLNLSIADGEFFALLGPSGCGKTTLLRTIAGLEDATKGTLSIGERDVTRKPPGSREVAMVFQDYALFPHMSVADNIAYPLKIKGRPKAERYAKVDEVSGQLGLAKLLDRKPGALSGGQQQRVALARAVACHPQVFLFDEPLSNLDARLRLEARTFLKKLQRELGVTTVFVTHDQAEALALADRIAVMDAGQIRQLGTPREVFSRPADTFVANFIGSTPMNLLPGTVTDGELVIGDDRLALPEPVAPQVGEGDKVVVGVRPEYLELTVGEGPGLTGEVSILENLGTSTLVTVACGELNVGATVPEEDEPTPGQRVHLKPVPGRLLVYRDGDGTLINGG